MQGVEIMGIDKLVNDVGSEISMEFIKYNNVYYVNSSDSRIMFVLEIKTISDITDFIEELDMDDFYKEFNKYFSEKDILIEFNLKSFLWDLYVIAIHYCGENKIDDFEKIKIEKDRFVARKIIIDDESEDLIKSKMINIINPVKEFEELLLDDTTTPDEEIDNISNSLLSDSNLRERIQRIPGILTEDLSSKDKILAYLEYIANTENYTLDGGE